MKAMEKDWYQKNWTLDIQNMSWVEDTGRQVDFLIKQLQLKGTEKILDLACGFGRHSLEFARRGYDVTGIDITPAYIDYANEQAKKENLNAKFICQDIRTITYLSGKDCRILCKRGHLSCHSGRCIPFHESEGNSLWLSVGGL